MMPLAKRISSAAFWMLLSIMSGCANYQVGQQALYRPDIRTVHVPVFESISFRPHLGERLSEAVAAEIETKTPYRVVPAERAESILQGRIVTEQKRVIAEDQFDVPRVIDAEMVVVIDWYGPQGELLANNITVPVDNYDLTLGQSQQFIPEGGQSVATAQQKVIEELAEQIVSQMEIPPW